MNGLVLGLDIGIASVGVGILKKDTGEIIHANSRLFPAATADNNVERRGFRGGRMLLKMAVQYHLITVRQLKRIENYLHNKLLVKSN